MTRPDPLAAYRRPTQVSRLTLGRAQRGNGSALQEVYRTHVPDLVAYYRAHRFRCPDELAREAFRSILPDIDLYDGAASALRRWILGRAAEAFPRTISALREKMSDEVHDVYRCLDDLAWDRRELLILRVVVGLDLDETADVLARPTDTVWDLQVDTLAELATMRLSPRQFDRLEYRHAA